ncbi:MAG: hypothetical protein NTX49_10160 [Chlamydiae bacterium]|nr:hypothetical protein [Chlamydiota bacterium]
MTITQVMTAPPMVAQPQYEVLRLRLLAPVEDRRPLDERVAGLVEAMLASDHLSEERKHNLGIWLSHNLHQFAPEGEGSTPEDLADILCSLLVDFIRPLMLETDEEGALDEATSFDKTVKLFLEQILPRGMDVDEFIFQHEEFNEEFLIAQEAKELVDEATDELVEAEADAVWDRGGERFIATRDSLEQAMLRRETRADDVDTAVRSLTGKVKGTASTLSDLKGSSEQQIEHMRRQLQVAKALASAAGSKLTMGAIDSL